MLEDGRAFAGVALVEGDALASMDLEPSERALALLKEDTARRNARTQFASR